MEDRIAMLRARVAGLSPAERDAFRAKVEAAGIDWARVAPAGPPAPRPARIPLSLGQMHFWLLQQVHPDSAAFTIAFAWQIDGPLDRDALARALAHLVARHEPLRTAFPSADGAPWQEVVPDPGFRLEDAKSAEPEEAERAFVARPFDLATAPLFRAQLQTLAPERHRLLFAFHHIVADGWSRGVFLRELAVCYRAFRAGRAPALPPLPRQFADLVLDQSAWLETDDARAQEAFWRRELDGLAPQELPTRAASSDRSAATELHEIDRALAVRVAPAAALLGVTPFMLLLAVFQLLLHRLSGSDDIAVGTPNAGRTTPEAEGLIGLFVNTLVLRARPEPGMSFRSWLDRVQSAFGRAFDHQAVPFARVVEAVGAERRPGRNPLFQTLFQVQSGGYGPQNADTVDLGDPRLEVRQRIIPLPEAKFDLSWHVMERQGGLSVIVEYRSAVFGPDWAVRMVAWFDTLLAAALDRPDAEIETLGFVPAAEEEAATLRGDETVVPSLASILNGHIATPGPALIDHATHETWSAAELDAVADRLARCLCARPELAHPDARLAICLPRGPDLVTALLAALKAGIPYVPLDPAHPEARRDAILADAGAGLILAEGDMAAPCPVLDPATLGAEAPEAGLPDPDPERLAYLIYTSGSTGRPKGVPVTRRSLSNLIASMARQPGLRPGDRLLAVTTVAFDIALLELLLPRATGATLVLADRDTATALDRLAAVLDQHGITHMQATPATWRLLVESGWAGRPGLTALCGGEVLPSDLARALLDRTAGLWNLYGPTETTIWSAALRVRDEHLTGAQVPIGGPIASTTLRVLDPYGETMPPGVPGELAIGGAGLSPGYWRRPDLTAERFVDAKDARLYRTGDRVRLEPDGTLGFLGRLDHQIKLNGHRIEPGEVEAALAALPEIAEALVIAESGRLVAYCRTAGALPDAARLRAELARRLPGYMIPTHFVALDAFPLNPNGKIDRSRLPSPERPDAGRGAAATTAAEKALQALWAEVLGRDDVGVDDNFFDLGGASVSAMQIASRARSRGLVLSPAQMFEHQTVAAQAAAARPVAAAATLPLSPWQRACRSEPGPPHHFRLPVPPGTDGRLDEAVAALTAAHPVLRLALGPDGWAAATAGPPDTGDTEGWAEAVLRGGPLWRARIRAGSLEIAAHPLLLDARSVERLAAQARGYLRGDPGPVGDKAYLRWLQAPPGTAMPSLAPFPGDGPGVEETPVVQSLDTARLRALRVGAQAQNASLAQIMAAALLRTLAAWRGGGPVSLALVEDAPAETLGHFTRLVPLGLDAVPADPAAAIRAVSDTLAAGDARGIDPRQAPAGLAVLSWTSRPADDGQWLQGPGTRAPAAPALHVEATEGAETLDFTWRFDATAFLRATIARLAARHFAELAPTPAAAGAGKLDRLRARLSQGNG